MSRIGKKSISVPDGVSVSIDGNYVKVKGPMGSLERELHETVAVRMDGSTLHVELRADSKFNRRFWGLSRTLLDNMVTGCHVGFSKTLTLVGVGYRAAAEGRGLTLTLGYSHPVKIDEIPGIEFKVEKATSVVVTGASKEMVGEVASKIRSKRPPEPYHGKGVRYADEVIATKVGKASGKK